MPTEEETQAAEERAAVEVAEAEAAAAAEERPEANLKAENVRKAAEIERLRAENDALRLRPVAGKDPADLSTWPDHELRAVAASPDPQYAVARERAREVLDDRRVQRIVDQREQQRMKESAEEERMRSYPETLDPSHPMAVEMKKILRERRLEGTPAGYLTAAELAAARLRKPALKAQGAEAERERLAGIRANFSGDDRPAPRPDKEENQEDLKKKAFKDGKVVDDEAFNKILGSRIIRT